MNLKNMYSMNAEFILRYYMIEKYGVHGNMAYGNVSGKELKEELLAVCETNLYFDNYDVIFGDIDAAYYEVPNGILCIRNHHMSYVYVSKDHTYDLIMQLFEKHKRIFEPNKLSLILRNSSGFKTKSFKLPNPNIDISKVYNDDFQPINDVILKRLNTPDDKGIVCLHGTPGGGKTTYIRHLVHEVKDKSLIFVPPSLAAHLTDPSFMEFLLDFSNAILIIEDAENILLERKLSNGQSSVADLLNIGDGLLSSIMNIQIVCTFNTELSKVDQAILRKGRIIAEYEFQPLAVDKCNVINQELGMPMTTKPMTLAELYNQDEMSFQKEQTKIRFL